MKKEKINHKSVVIEKFIPKKKETPKTETKESAEKIEEPTETPAEKTIEEAAVTTEEKSE
jgi:hypothetical protein